MHTHAHTNIHTHTEVERNLAADNVLTLNHWHQFNEYFPTSIPSPDSNQLTQMESMVYRCVEGREGAMEGWEGERELGREGWEGERELGRGGREVYMIIAVNLTVGGWHQVLTLLNPYTQLFTICACQNEYSN